MRTRTGGPQALGDAAALDRTGTLSDPSASAHLTGWDRAVVVALGGAGCVLSYDALQQMAVAIHVRGPLTYLFPVVIDGFIAYGVRALLVLRDAPLRARLYLWLLFGTATAVSVWANALHAVLLNQQLPATGGLRLSDAVVAVLSTIAPLALAGAVHLYILIARGPVRDLGRAAAGGRNRGDRGDRGDLAQTGRPALGPVADSGARSEGDLSPDPGADGMLEIARSAVRAEGKLTRQVVARAIRGRQIPLSSSTLTALMVQLREQHGQMDSSPSDNRPHPRGG